MINFNLIEKDKWLLKEGKFLVRTISTSQLKTVNIFTARITKVFNQKKNIFEPSIDVNNQIVTHISELPIE